MAGLRLERGGGLENKPDGPKDLYQQADPSTILKAVLHTGEFREAK